MWKRYLIFGVFLSLDAAVPVVASEWLACASSDAELRLSGCTKIIESTDVMPKDRALVYQNHGMSHNEKGQYDQAIKDFNVSIELRPGSALAYYGRGSAFISIGSYGEAIDDLNKAISLDPAYTAAYIHRGFAFRSIGDVDRAIADLETAIRLSPALVWPRKELLELQAAKESRVR